MKIDRLWPRVAAAVGIIALVLVTNEGYRHVRSLVDTVSKSKQDIAVLKRDLYVLQVQLDNGPGVSPGKVSSAAVPFSIAAPAPASPVGPYEFPLPPPMAPTLGVAESPVRARPKVQTIDEPKSLVSVVLMSDEKAAAAPVSSGTKQPDGPKMEVKLIGEAK